MYKIVGVRCMVQRRRRLLLLIINSFIENLRRLHVGPFLCCFLCVVWLRCSRINGLSCWMEHRPEAFFDPVYVSPSLAFYLILESPYSYFMAESSWIGETSVNRSLGLRRELVQTQETSWDLIHIHERSLKEATFFRTSEKGRAV